MGDVGRCIYENMEILTMKDAYTFYVCVKDYYRDFGAVGLR